MSNLWPDRRVMSDDCLSDLVLDRLVTGEADPKERSVADAHAKACPSCQSRWEAIRDEQSEFAAKAPPLRVPALAPVASIARLRWAQFAAAGGVLATAAAVVLAVITSPRPDAETISGMKGGETIGFFVQRGSHVREGVEGDRLRPRDRIRFTYTTDRSRYLAIVSMDGEHNVTVYFPPEDVAHRVRAARNRSLPVATELDEILGPEVVHAFFCDGALSPAKLRESVAGQQAVPDGCVERLLHFTKELDSP